LKDTDLIRPLIALNTYRSIRFLAGRGYAEAFYVCSSQEYQALFDQISRKKPATSGN